MNISRFLLPLGLALLSTLAFQYFFFSKYQTTAQTGVSGQTFVAPTHAQELKPLNREINFIDEQAKPAEITSLRTQNAEYVFSTHGARLEKYTFYKPGAAGEIALSTLADLNEFQKERSCFLLAFADKTPFYYTLIDTHEQGDTLSITYQAQTDEAVVEKTYTVYQKTFQIDCALKVTPKTEKAIETRFFYPAPITTQITPALVDARSLAPDNAMAIYNNQKGNLEKQTREKVAGNQGWFAPKVFGGENHFFVHTLINDPQSVISRGYFTALDKTLMAIIEGPVVKQPTSWSWSFYIGPKEEEAMAVVDPRLEQLLEYSGILAPLSRILLKALNLIYHYVHNYGWAIVLLTLLINLLLLPLRIRGTQSMKKATEFQKKLAYLQQRHKHDPAMLEIERAELIAKHGMPGFGGCLPILIQFPIFFALSRVLSGSLELYQAPFVLWITNLSAPDPLYILPVLVAITTIAQGVSTGDIKQQFMAIGMGLFFGALATSFSAGLCLYILVGTVIFLIQTAFTHRFSKA